MGPAEAPWEVLQGALNATAVVAAGLAYGALLWLLAAHHASPRWDLYAGPLLLAVGTIAVLAWKFAYRLRAALLVALLFACSLAIHLATGLAQAHLLYLFACLVAGVLLGPWAATALAAVATAVVWMAPAAPSAQGDTWWNLGALWLAVALVWVALGRLLLAVRQAQAEEAYAWRQANEARMRRGELVRTQKALSETYGLLQRANHELAVARQQADEARQIKAQFAANVSHELRTPLNLIMGFSEIMYGSPEAYGQVRWPPTLRADVREIYHASRHLLGMIDDILDLSRIEAQRLPLRLEATDLGELIREMVATSSGLLRGKDVGLEVNLPAQLPPVLVDRTRIRQVLLNLLNNAIRFTDHGRIEISAALGAGEVTVAVADTGVGIPADEIPLIFEEFRQAKGPITSGRGGAGLGLAICKQFIRLHGGGIEAESEVGRGSTFRFTLPLPAASPVPGGLFYYAPEGWSPPVPENPLGRTAVVLGPDSEANAALARAVQGYRTLCTQDLEGLAQQVESEHPAGIIVLEDTDGATTLGPDRVWQAAGRDDLPIVRCMAPIRGLALRELGVAGYLAKPIRREQVAAAIRRACPAPASILLIDDDPGFVALMQRMLGAEFEGVRTRGAYTGGEALAILAEEPFDVILLDLVMPETGGVEVIEAMRRQERLAALPVIVTTGTGYEEEAAGLHPGRIELLASKGCGRSELGRYVTALLEVAPPDYSHPTPPVGQPAAAAGKPAS